MNGVLHYFWRAVNQDGDEIEFWCKSVKIKEQPCDSLSGY
nr:transposase [Psychromonas sp. RZ22]